MEESELGRETGNHALAIIMAQEASAWWALQYQRYSIRDLNRLPVFHRFVQIHYPFELADSHAREKYSTVDEKDTYEWEDFDAKKHEVLEHDRKTGKYNYSLNYHDLESPVHIQSWWLKDLEGGSITRDYQDYQVVESWAIEADQKVYERYTEEKGVKRGFKAGIKGQNEDSETWVEEIWTHDDENQHSKAWSQLGNSGGSTETTKGDYSWGESWNSSTEGQEKKYWHKQGTRDWGHHSGSDAFRRWDHSWDFNDSKRFEEKVTVKGDRDSGYRLRGEGQDWYKQEWEGRKVVGPEEEADRIKEAGLRSRLDGLFAAELAASHTKQQSIATLASYFPEFQPKVAALASRRLAAATASHETTNELLDLLFTLRDVQNDQEKLNQEMSASIRDDAARLGSMKKTMADLMENSLTTLSEMKPKGQLKHREEIEGWKGSHEAFFSQFQSGCALLTGLEIAKRDFLSDHSGLGSEDIQAAMSTLYNIMVKHDAVSDKIVDITNATDFKAELDRMEDSFEAIHTGYQQDKDPRRLMDMLKLLLEYQPIHLHLVGRIRGYSREEMDKELGVMSEVAQGTSLKGAKAKVKGARAAKLTPFQVMDQHLNRFIPVLNDLLKSSSVPEAELEPLLEAGSRSVDSGEPIEVLSEKIAVIAEAGDKAASLRS